jgi:multidrug efflux pump subunit AcrA (membrane-fusion protein)
MLLVALVLLDVGGAGWVPTAPTPQPSPTPVRYDARGRVAPVAQARVGTMQGGIVRSVPSAGRSVVAGEEIARIESPAGGAETLLAPFGGTVLAVLVQVGDTVVPGAPVVVVGDLTRLRVETTDVDEYLVAHLRVGQEVAVAVDALPGRELVGRIAEITLTPTTTASGDLHYPVYVALEEAVPGLRPGMTARIRART